MGKQWWEIEGRIDPPERLEHEHPADCYECDWWNPASVDSVLGVCERTMHCPSRREDPEEHSRDHWWGLGVEDALIGLRYGEEGACDHYEGA